MGRTATIVVDRGEIELRDEPGGPPPLVFLHEGLGSISLWRDFPDAVRAAAGSPRTIVYSRHGYGRSAVVDEPRTVGYMHHEAGVVLPLLLQRLGVVRPVLVGHSDGASIALLHAGGGADVGGLVLIAPHVFVEEVSIRGIEAARQAWERGEMEGRMARHHDDATATFRGWNDVWRSPEFRSWNIEDRLPGIRCPVLLVQGDADPYGSVAQLDAIERGVGGPTDRLLLPGAGHAPHLQVPTVTAAVAAFVRRAGAGPRGSSERHEATDPVDAVVEPGEQ